MFCRPRHEGQRARGPRLTPINTDSSDHQTQVTSSATMRKSKINQNPKISQSKTTRFDDRLSLERAQHELKKKITGICVSWKSCSCWSCDVFNIWNGWGWLRLVVNPFFNFLFFSCIAGRVRDIVGQLLEFWWERKLITAEIPWKQENNKTRQTQPTTQTKQAQNTGTTARENRKTRWNKVRHYAPLSAPHWFSSTM